MGTKTRKTETKRNMSYPKSKRESPVPNHSFESVEERMERIKKSFRPSYNKILTNGTSSGELKKK